VAVTNNFTAPAGTDYLLRIYNGGRDNQYRPTSRAAVWLNGIKIVRPRDFNTRCGEHEDNDDSDDERDDNDTQHNVQVIEKRVTLTANNTLVVKLRGARSSGITLEIVGIDRDPPTITATKTPAPNAAGWNNANVVVNFNCADALSGIAFCQPAVTVTNEGANQIVAGRATDRAGNNATTHETVKLDRTPPKVLISSPANGSTVNTSPLAVMVKAGDWLSGLGSVTCNGQAATLNGSSFICNVNLQAGVNNIQAQATDVAGNIATSSISVTLAGNNSSPSLTNLNAPATLVFGQGTSVSFNYSDSNGDIVAVETTRTNALGQLSASIPASVLSINGTSGQVTIQLEQNELAFGDNAFTLQLRDSQNQTSNVVSFNIRVTGETSGGAAPTLANFNSSAPRWNRPTGSLEKLRPSFSFSYADADGDIFLVRKRVTLPNSQPIVTEESAESVGINSTSGSLSKQFLTLRSADPLGVYQIELTLIDRNGNTSNTAAASFELVASGGDASLSISDFTPQQGAAGTTVTINGDGFDAATPENNRVTLSSIDATVSAATTTSLTATIPAGASSGQFVIRNQNGVAASSAMFTVPASLSVSPGVASVVVGGSLQFETEIVSSNETNRNWSVNGVNGGDATVGTISAEGLYRAPADIPAGGPVTITASLANSANVAGNATVTILPPPVTAGSANLLASTGGVVRSNDGRASVSIPAGALSANTLVSVSPLYSSVAPQPLPSRRVIGAVRFGPSPLNFNSAVTVTIPLVRYYRPNTHLALRYFNEQTNSYTSEQLTAIVNETGEVATASVTHFSTWVVDDSETLAQAQAVCQSPIAIASETTGGFTIQEGMNVPVRLFGSGFTPDLRVRIIADHGGQDTDIIPGTLYTLGDYAGVLLDVQTIPDLGQSQVRAYTLRLERAGNNCQFAEIPIGVQGLNEFDPNNPVAGRYSEINVLNSLLVPFGGLFLESTGPVNIAGLINGAGERGADANDQQCGGLQAGEDSERCGLNGQPGDGRGGLGRGNGDDEPFYFGNGGDIVTFRHVSGGNPGANIDGNAIVTDLAQAVASGFACFGGDLPACNSMATNAVSAANNIEEVTEPHNGQPGKGVSSELSFRNGGGGGGGGFISSPPLGVPPPYTGSSLKILGGGGGGGGRSGHGFRITSADQILVTGQINVAGGDGGNGSNMSRLALDAPLLLPTLYAPVSVPGFSGGGGGGGTGATILLVSAENLAFSNSSDAQVINKGGRGGAPDEGSSRARGDGGFRGLGDSQRSVTFPIFDTTTIDNSVTNRSALSLRIAETSPDPLIIRIEGENNNQEFPATFNNGSHMANVLLFHGFNTLCVNTEPNRNCGATPLLEKRVLSVFVDTDGDGISDLDETTLGTNPNSSDSDGDGLSDGDEFVRGTNPLNPDTDSDGLLDGEEITRGTNPLNPDTDGDGVSDGLEVLLGSNPLSATSIPNMIPNGRLLGQSGRDLLVLGTSTGIFGVLGQPTLLGFGLALDETGTIFIADNDRLRIFEPFTSINTVVGTFGAPDGDAIEVSQLAFNPAEHRLYGVELSPTLNFAEGQLVRIDQLTGVAVRVGLGAGVPIHAIAFRSDGVMFATVRGDATTDRFVELNPTTGAIVRDIGPVGLADVYGLAFDLNHVLFGSQHISGTQSRLMTIDPATGLATAGPFVARELFSLAVMPCAAPCLDQPAAINLPFVSEETRVADLNNDSNPDIVTGNGQVLLGDGTGHFTLGATLTGASRSVALADLDLDGDMDIVLGNRGVQPQTIRVFLNDGAANFTQVGSTYQIPGNNTLTTLEVGNLNGDGMPDIAARGGTVTFILNGLGGGTFVAPNPVSSGNFGVDFTLADINGDGSLDIVSTGLTGTIVHLNNGSGTFTATQVDGFAQATSVAAGDLNGDGRLDIALSTGEFRGAGVLLNNGNGSFAPLVRYRTDARNTATLFFPIQVAIGDLTGDGSPDLVTANLGNFSVLNNNRQGGFRIALRSPFSVFNNSALHVSTGDVDRNGRQDVIVSNGISITVLLNHNPY
jgi:hypothetical protein